jgi:general secretion pathway protein D
MNPERFRFVPFSIALVVWPIVSIGPLAMAQEASDATPLREKTRVGLLEEVGKGWERPAAYEQRNLGPNQSAVVAPLIKKLNEIVLPNISFTRAEIGQVVGSLSAASEEFDPTPAGVKGVNIVLIDPANEKPLVTIALRNTTLKRALDFVTEGIGYQYEVQADAVLIRPGGETQNLETQFFPVTRATVLRMTGMSGGAQSGPKDQAPSRNTAGTGPSSDEAAGIRNFLQQAGVSFATEGSALAYDGSAIIVTQTTRNIERIRNIVSRYNDVRQVEIESKFMEVQEGALEELGVQWQVSRRGVPQVNPATGQPVLDHNGRQVFVPQETYTTAGINRSLVDAFPSTTRRRPRRRRWARSRRQALQPRAG